MLKVHAQTNFAFWERFSRKKRLKISLFRLRCRREYFTYIENIPYLIDSAVRNRSFTIYEIRPNEINGESSLVGREIDTLFFLRKQTELSPSRLSARRYGASETLRILNEYHWLIYTAFFFNICHLPWTVHKQLLGERNDFVSV